MNPWAPQNSASTLTAEQQQLVDAAVRARTSHVEDLVTQLTEQVNNLKSSANTASSQPQNQRKPAKKASDKQPAVKIKVRMSDQSSSNHKNSSAAPPKAPANLTPQRPARAASVPLEVGKPKASTSKKSKAVKQPSPKRHPQQMQTTDVPLEFASTKNALFVHIKILWGLLKQDSVPQAPELRNLQEFYNRFSNGQEVEQAAQASTSPALINTDEVQLFKDATTGSIKYGRSVIHLGSNNVRYAQGLMVRLGLRTWCPNLDEDSASLYNAAHRIAAITTFQELVAGQAYKYMNVNAKMASQTSYLIQAYNHFVHFIQHTKYHKEKKQEGKNAQDASNKRVSKNRERLRDARKEFAILNKFPPRYVHILSQIGAHSDDEHDEKANIYKIKTLPYRSKNASKFIRALDIVMKNAAEQDPSSYRKRRVRKLPRQPVMSTFTAAPKGLPIDFYDPSWYHKLVPAQQKTIPNTQAVAFLPDASQSLLPKKQRHPDEKLTDSSFTRKYWDIVVEPYGLLGDESSDESDDEEEAQGMQSAAANDSEGEGHNLDDESPDESPDEYFEEGDAGDLYDDDIEDDEEGDDEEEYNINDEDDEEDEQYSDTHENTDDVHMKDRSHGVDARTLAIMEEEEDGW
ncbi:uncharacterized protein PGTG_00839 [Puccinia graminis f. sp. tritici CRL 75-36-700-3]|uniref:Uncharacterized protein n=1 Tax=Puccinia graminis f. sp. tritici (strain CRL 75-36-700-3 / race SCCL) TaxID=418459 RepID=E3JTY7_PUCGT|nr:uncharacterized protein PGTG_00839 [Puccinia graminis f. sp. tritici CRL 75-36-700-3]EFP75508.1 hypothetical protein PGTG_00839 [Puccinia graminis f. sp. tritici CRL 75-36-700-3]